MNLFQIFTSLENADDLHLSRLLILVDIMVDHNENKPINGLTKLVKLDFLLRYPVYLEKALDAINVKTGQTIALDYERNSVESSMIRYHYGPWDPRYRRFINLLVCKGLAYVYLDKRTIKIGVTKLGCEKAAILAMDSVNEDIVVRSKLLRKYFESWGATKLKDFLYTTFPEIGSLNLGEEIKNEF